MPADKIQTLTRAIALLDCFTMDRPELGVREAARLVNLSTSATGRMLSALRELGILNQNSATRTYSMGSKVLTWAGVYTSNLDVRNLALPALQELHSRTSETISLYILENNERLCVERLESPQNVRIVARVGRRLPLYAGSAGKAMLAFLPLAQREEYLRNIPLTPLTSQTMVDPDSLRQELEKIREQGYAVSHGEWILEAAGVAIPIFDQKGEVLAAISISGPDQRFTEEKVAQYVPELTRVAAQISRELGYQPKP